MPTYEFKCRKCGAVRSATALPEDLDELKTKMWCHGEKMARLFRPATILFKGDGWACKTGKGGHGNTAET